MDPVTTAGLTLAVIPLIISAIENYEYTFQPILIFFYEKRYQKEVERCQTRLKIQHANFHNECFLLLLFLKVSFTSSNEMTTSELKRVIEHDSGLESRLKDRLELSYDACLSSLSLISKTLKEIFEETRSLYLLTEKKKREGFSIAWFKKLRQKSKISFSKDRFNDKFQEVGDRIDDLHKLRKQLQSIDVFEKQSKPTLDFHLRQYRQTRIASKTLHDAISTHWRCDLPDVHLANMCLGSERKAFPQESRNFISFDLTWTCPKRYLSQQQQRVEPIRLLIESLSQPKDTDVATSDQKPCSDLITQLEMTLNNSHGAGSSTRGSTMAISGLNYSSTLARTIPNDLSEISNLCFHLEQHQADVLTGFLEDTRQGKHVLRSKCWENSQNSMMITLRDRLRAMHLKDASSMPDVELAALLALAVLRFYSTPWLQDQWQSQDIVFFGDEGDLSPPYLKSRIEVGSKVTSHPEKGKKKAITSLGIADIVPKMTNTSIADTLNTENEAETTAQRASGPSTTSISKSLTAENAISATAINRTKDTLYNLGVLLIEIVYKSPLEDLKNDTQDTTLDQTVLRLGSRIWREMGPEYAHAVSICLYEGLGPSADIEDFGVQESFFEQVVAKIEKCAAAVRSF